MVCGLSIIYLLLPAVKQREVARSAVGLPLRTSKGQVGASTHKPHITFKRTDKHYRLSIGNTSLPHAHMAGSAGSVACEKIIWRSHASNDRHSTVVWITQPLAADITRTLSLTRLDGTILFSAALYRRHRRYVPTIEQHQPTRHRHRE